METIKPIFLQVLMAVVLIFLGGSLEAATFTVTKTGDTNDGSCDNTDCSLREAVIAANTMVGTDTIEIPAGTYVLSLGGRNENAAASGDLDIAGDMTISGSATGATTIDANGLDRVFHIRSGQVALSGMTLKGGDPGDGEVGLAILNAATLTLTQVSIRDNSNAAVFGTIYNTHKLTIIRSLFSSNTTTSGGCLYSDGGTTSISESTLSGNTSGQACILNNSGEVTIDRTTINGNTSKSNSGGIYSAATLTITNSTLSGNTAASAAGDGGAIFIGAGTTNLNHVTITANVAQRYGGGVYRSGGTLNLKNTIIASNTANGRPDCYGTLNSQGYNLIQDTTDCTIGGDTTGNVIGRDPRLGSLASNGGSTQTHLLQSGSPAIDGGSGCLATDQRGFVRGSANGLCDIGAYEVACGDGQVQAFSGEECDDGNTDDKDSCLNSCVTASCGDGVVRKSVEACDDGNRVDNDSCTNACVLPTCGDRIVQSGEECDDGGHNSSTEPDACRVACLNPSCGDNVIDTGEECDGGDSCDLSCRLEDEKTALPTDEHPEGPDSPDPLVSPASPDSPDVADHEDEDGNPAAGGCSLIRNASPPVGPAEIPGSV